MGFSAQAFFERSVFLPRPQGVNLARQDAGLYEFIHRIDTGYTYWNLAITPSYEQSFGCAIARQLIGASNTMIFSGSRVEDRAKTDILADYVGLPADFKSTVTFSPLMRTFVLDFDWYVGFDEWCEGFYMRLYSPVVYTQWNLTMCEDVTSAGTALYPAGYLGPQRLEADDLLHSVAAAFKGDFTFGDMREPLAYGRICGSQSLVNMADLRLLFGYDFTRQEKYTFGVEFFMQLPTSKPAGAKYLFQPQIGNGGHWEFGFGFCGEVAFWHSDDESSLGLFLFDSAISHLCKSHFLRSYDLRNNGPGSRYMLLEEVADPSIDLFVGNGGPVASNQYKQRLLPAINVTTFDTSINIAVQADIALRVAFYKDAWNLEVGYKLFARSAENLICRDTFAGNIYAVKGDAQVYGFDNVSNVPIAVNATQSSATLYGGQGVGNFTTGELFKNINADNPAIAASDNGPLEQLDATDGPLFGGQGPINLSNPALLLAHSDINECSGLAPHAISNTLFIHTGYTGQECHNYIPYIGVGAEVEVVPGCMTGTLCNTNGASAQWGVWIKGGVAY